jgi:hypothetical protein
MEKYCDAAGMTLGNFTLTKRRDDSQSRRFSFMLNFTRNNPSSVAISPPRTVTAKPRSTSRVTIPYGSPRNGGVAATAFSAVSSAGVSGSGRKMLMTDYGVITGSFATANAGSVIAPCIAAMGYENIMSGRGQST